jgi:hypothetical protein
LFRVRGRQHRTCIIYSFGGHRTWHFGQNPIRSKCTDRSGDNHPYGASALATHRFDADDQCGEPRLVTRQASRAGPSLTRHHQHPSHGKLQRRRSHVAIIDRGIARGDQLRPVSVPSLTLQFVFGVSSAQPRHPERRPTVGPQPFNNLRSL